MYFFFFSEINCKKVLIVSFVINKRLLFSSLLGYPPFTVQHKLNSTFLSVSVCIAYRKSFPKE